MVIPDGVTEIGNKAFSNNANLTSVVIPNSVTTIGNGAFYGCEGLESVVVPEGVTYIGKQAFVWCSNLKSVTIPNSVTYIGDNAFHNCSSLASVVFPDNVSYVGAGAFQYCPLPCDDEGFAVLGDRLIQYNGRGTEVTIPSGVKIVCSGALLYSFYVLHKIVIPESANEIEGWAFSGDSSPMSIEILGDEMKLPVSKLSVFMDKYKPEELRLFAPRLPFSVLNDHGLGMDAALTFIERFDEYDDGLTEDYVKYIERQSLLTAVLKCDSVGIIRKMVELKIITKKNAEAEFWAPAVQMGAEKCAEFLNQKFKITGNGKTTTKKAFNPLWAAYISAETAKNLLNTSRWRGATNITFPRERRRFARVRFTMPI